MSLSQVSGCLSCEHGIGLELLLPHLAGVIVEAAELAGGRPCKIISNKGRADY